MSSELPSAEQVVAYLKAHKNFFVDHEALLADISIPHETGKAVSLVERQVVVLRERNVELRERLTHLLDVARENDVLFEKMRSLTLALLETKTVAQLAVALERELRQRFGSEYVSFLLFDVSGATGAAQSIALTSAQEKIPALVRGRQVITGQLRKDELQFLFGHEGEQVRSCAVVPVQHERPLGLLAIGSSNADHFRSTMDTLFISFIGDVLARVLLPLLGGDAARQTA
ncbi:MAG: DUF484 family protein [Moraxellaceae bacterium]|jgi:uncharacterized protein YigA (DUF484 family)|nr:DUF484 family protein [Moraxellaceae bacterium]MBP7229166.1 DUF484 family protein [Moraxellaceae bacterium]MBP9045528.1 DUF484 family protein [Moraxellaceae bacterium]MBP9731266.1 DUF484 family protein [Moraxellaceae bacterium]MCC6199331.1 DUF484 family protein [Moraxellaceae bacterium]